MKNYLLRITSLAVAACSVITLASCKGKTNDDIQTETPTYEKSVTSQTVKIVNIPTDPSKLADMLNAAFNYVDGYCYKYKKDLTCEASVSSLGSLSSVSNASDAFASIFGEKSITADYDYQADKKLFADNFVKGPIESGKISSISAKQDGDTVILTANLNGETDPTEENGILHNLGGDYVSADSVKASLAEFKSSASSVSVSADEISIVARISAEDSSLRSMTVTYTEHFSLSGVTLVKQKGGSVSGSAKTVIRYTDFG